MYEKIRERAAGMSEDEFVRWIKTPALVLRIDEEAADFTTRVGITTGDFELSDPRSEELEKIAVRLVAKSERNPYADRISVGRTQACDVVIRHPSVSKLHAHFIKLPDGWYGIRDAKSKNGVRVNGQSIGSDATVRLAPDDELVLGAVEAKFVYPAALYALAKMP